MRHGVVSMDKGETLIPRARRTASAWERMRGLLGSPPLADDEALWIEPCPSVHTLGMRYAIDVVFLDREDRVCKVVAGLRPFRFAACRGARSTLELGAGRAGALGIAPGVKLAWQEGA